MRGLNYTDSFFVIRYTPTPTPIATTDPAIMSFPRGMSSPGGSLWEMYIAEAVPNVPIPVVSKVINNAGFMLITSCSKKDLLSR